jgi:uncharacterized membrane protein YphA (DoxX/SURF4 family)
MLLMRKLFARICAGVLGVVMIVAINRVFWGDVNSLNTLLDFSDAKYLVIFFLISRWGARKVSIDYWLRCE